MLCAGGRKENNKIIIIIIIILIIIVIIINLCEAHICPYDATVSARGTHGVSCKMSTGSSFRLHQINYLIWRALKRSDAPAAKEPAGLLRDDGKRPNGFTLVPWQNGRCLTWNATMVNTLATCYLASTSSHNCSTAEGASIRNKIEVCRHHTNPHFRSGGRGNLRTNGGLSFLE